MSEETTDTAHSGGRRKRRRFVTFGSGRCVAVAARFPTLGDGPRPRQ